MDNMDDAVPTNARASPSSSLANRRQKNLKKFRKHKEAQRQTLRTVVLSETNTALLEEEQPEVALPKPNKATTTAVVATAVDVAVEDEVKKEEQLTAMKEASNNTTVKAASNPVANRKRFQKRHVMAKKEVTPVKPAAKQEELTVLPPAATAAATSDKSKTPTLPLTIPQQQGHHHQNATRRSEIIRKLAKKNHRVPPSPKGATTPKMGKLNVVSFDEKVQQTVEETAHSAENDSIKNAEPSGEAAAVDVTYTNTITTADPPARATSPTTDTDQEEAPPSSQPIEFEANNTDEPTDQSVETASLTPELMAGSSTNVSEDGPVENSKAVVDTAADVSTEELSAPDNDKNAEEMQVQWQVAAGSETADTPEEEEKLDIPTNEEIVESMIVDEQVLSGDGISEASDENDESNIQMTGVYSKPAHAAAAAIMAGPAFTEHASTLKATASEGVEAPDIVSPTQADTRSDHLAEATSEDLDTKEDTFKQEAACKSEETTTPSVVEEYDLNETSTSFDLRSIHDFPTEAVQTAEAALPSKDPSWDTAKVMFSEFEKPAASKAKSNDGTLNMFDTAEDPPGAAAENCTFSQEFQVGDDDFSGSSFFSGRDHSLVDEKKESESNDVQNALVMDHHQYNNNQKSLVVEAEGEESNESIRWRLSRMHASSSENTNAVDAIKLATGGFSHPYDVTTFEKDEEQIDPAESAEIDRDDEGLLTNTSIDNEEMELIGILYQPSKEERLQQYTNTDADDDNSSVDTSIVDEHHDDESLGEVSEVGYVSASDEQEDFSLEQGEKAESDDIPAKIVEDAPAFVIPITEDAEVVEDAPAFVFPITEAALAAGSTEDSSTEAATQDPFSCPTPPEDSEQCSKPSSASISDDNEIGDAAALSVEQRVGNAVSMEPMVDAIQSISTSTSTSGSSTAVGNIAEAAEPGMVHLGYISHSSSGSTAEDQEACKRTKLEMVDNEDEIDAVESKTATTEQVNCGPTDNGDATETPSISDKMPSPEKRDLEESNSLVGVSLVPSWETSKSACLAKAGPGIPPRGKIATPLPPPPPPPLSKKKRKKKKKKDRKNSETPVPLLAPPPAEKLKKWEESKNRAVHFKERSESKSNEESKSATSTRRRPQLAPIDCQEDELQEKETWEQPPESPGRVHIPSLPNIVELMDPSRYGCGRLTKQASSPKKKALPKSQLTSFDNILSPVDAARNTALENAMKRATVGLAETRKFNGLLHPLRANSESEPPHVLALEANSMVDSSSGNSSANLEETRSHQSRESSSGGVEEPPFVTRKLMPEDEMQQNFPDFPNAFLQKLTSPSLSMTSPTSENCHTTLIHDSKMAEKMAIASYAAARTFEEQYAASHEYSQEGAAAGEPSLHEGEQDGSTRKQDIPSFFCSPEIVDNFSEIAGTEFSVKFEQELTGMMEGNDLFKDLVPRGTPSRASKEDEPHQSDIHPLKGGAFSPWKNAVLARNSEPTTIASDAVLSLASSGSSDGTEKSVNLTLATQETKTSHVELLRAHQWLTYEVLKISHEENIQTYSDDIVRRHMSDLLHDNDKLNKLCSYVADKVNTRIVFENAERAERCANLSPRKKMRPFQTSPLSNQKSPSVVAANFVSFLHRIAKVSDTPSPFGEDNPFLFDLISTSIYEGKQEGMLCTHKSGDDDTLQGIVFRLCPPEVLVKFTAQACGFNTMGAVPIKLIVEHQTSGLSSCDDPIEAMRAANPSPTKKSKRPFFESVDGQTDASADNSKIEVCADRPILFENAVKENPQILKTILDFLGDPACVCRIKMVNRDCQKFVAQNEQVLMRDAVRLGGLSMNLRPAFWLWVTLEKSGIPPAGCPTDRDEVALLEEAGRTGKWHHVIQRDVARSFGNMPPHKTGARLRNDSIVRALVTWGQSRIMKRGVKGSGNPPPLTGSQRALDCEMKDSEGSQAPMDTVSDWGGVSPVASFAGSASGLESEDAKAKEDGIEASRRPSRDSSCSVSEELMVLSGNALTDEMKADLQNKLGFILHALAARHEIVGYCQGMDYVVAHLLRILQDTIVWRAANGTLPKSILSAPKHDEMRDNDSLSRNLDEVAKTPVVEETVFRVMDVFFTTYNLQHMYWPELRCLKTCCRVFEKLIQIKLPVLADHFEHHELNVGLFALGWFQTLFLYLPSMPSATVCHMWDIWLVERSYKIFFRVATAILFLSQPILLNHELEGMMTYLNTFPDATLLNPDILIACALQIKITNKQLADIERSCGTN